MTQIHNSIMEIIKTASSQEVRLIKQDVEDGTLRRVIAERLAELELPQRVCPICNTPLDDNAPYVLFFGTTIRKKARFDAKDCLLYFLEDVEEKKKVEEKKIEDKKKEATVQEKE